MSNYEEFKKKWDEDTKPKPKEEASWYYWSPDSGVDLEDLVSNKRL